MLKLIQIFFLVFIINFNASSITVYDTVYINSGTRTIGNFSFEVCLFNKSSVFDTVNKVIEVSNLDVLNLHVVNNDNNIHSFTIDGIVDQSIPIGGTDDFVLNFPSQKAIRFYSKVPRGHLLGASSIIMSGFTQHAKYYWNMFEQSDTLATQISQGNVTTIASNYQPNVFTINMTVFPHTDNDTLSKVIQSVGDTIVIACLNSGKMLHSLHFHGYHVKILSASNQTHMNGWDKDTFGLNIGELVNVMLVPDQPGLYPVHEHNLINVTTNGVYPGGMINILEIQP